MIDWAGSIKQEQAFLVNADDATGLMEVRVYNPEAPDRFWADNDRLEEVVLDYRRAGDLSWRSARLANGSDMDFSRRESSFGYASLMWHVAGIPDGNYEIRIASHCTPVGLDAPEGINQARSTVITGLFDRVPPKMFGPTEPSDGVFNAGDTIAIELTEAIDCSRPFSFDVTVMLGSRIVVGKDALDIACEGRRLEISLINRFSASALAGSAVNVVVSGVRDLAENAMATQIKWAFKFEDDATAVPANVSVTGIRFNIAFNSSWTIVNSDGYQSFVSQLQRDLADMLSVAEARVHVSRLAQSSDGHTMVDLLFTSPTGAFNGRGKSDTSAEELAFTFMSLFGGQGELAINQTATNTTDDGSSANSKSLLMQLDLSAAPAQTLVQPADQPIVARPDITTTGASPIAGQSKASDNGDTPLVTVVLIFVILVVIQLGVLFWLMSATSTRMTRLLSRILSNTSSSGSGDVSQGSTMKANTDSAWRDEYIVTTDADVVALDLGNMYVEPATSVMPPERQYEYDTVEASFDGFET